MKSIKKGSVLMDTLKKFESEPKEQQKARRLNRALTFDCSLRLEKIQRDRALNLFKKLGIEGYKLEQKALDFEILIANLLGARSSTIRISLNRNDWKKSRYSAVSYFIINLIHILANQKLLMLNIGFNNTENPNQNRLTRIKASDELINFFPRYSSDIISKHLELVELKDNKKKLVEYKDTLETCRIRKILKHANKVNNGSDIFYKNERISTTLKAVFLEKFSWYGRIHTTGYRHVQSLGGKQERPFLTIDNEPATELDYQAIHPNLLYAYAEEKHKYNSGDPYSIIDNRPEVRPFLKTLLLALINSDSFTKAEKAGNYWLYENHDSRAELKSLGITSARPLLKKFISEHKRIAKYFCNGKSLGMKLMNKDSKIALKVINHFAKQNKVILPIHDSFIVQEKNKEELKQIMLEAYKAETNGCDIIVK